MNGTPIGIYGGTFDPIHFGHLRTAVEVQEGLQLNEVRFVPARIPPHRDDPGASPEDRLRMLAAAVADTPRLVVDERELRRPGPSFTVDTLRTLRAEVGSRPLCLVLGTDAFLGLPTWREPETILTLAHIIVVHRPGAQLPTAGLAARWLREHQGHGRDALAEQPAGVILPYPVTALDISATAIRRLLATGQSPRFLLPHAVLTIIQERGLYRKE